MTDQPAPASGAAAQPTQLSLAFSPTEDRLLLWLGSGEAAVRLHLTRRLVARLLDALAGVLAKSSLPASQAPAAMRDDLVLFEHQGVLATPAAPPADPEATLPLSGALHLVETVNIVTHPSSFEMRFVTLEGKDFPISLGRQDMHRVLELLYRQTLAAEWAIAVDADWLKANPTLN